MAYLLLVRRLQVFVLFGIRDSLDDQQKTKGIICRILTPWRRPGKPPEASVNEKDLGETDASFSAFFGNVAEAVGDSISHKLHPMIEQYAQLFAHGARTLVLRRPGDIGLDYEDLFFVTRRRSNRAVHALSSSLVSRVGQDARFTRRAPRFVNRKPVSTGP